MGSFNLPVYLIMKTRQNALRENRTCWQQLKWPWLMEAYLDILSNNGYPVNLTERYVRAESTYGSTTTKQYEANNSKFAMILLPWIGRASTNFAAEIHEAVRTSFADVEPRVVFKTTKAFSVNTGCRSGCPSHIFETFSYLWIHVQLWAHICGEDKPLSARMSQAAYSTTTAAELFIVNLAFPWVPPEEYQAKGLEKESLFGTCTYSALYMDSGCRASPGRVQRHTVHRLRENNETGVYQGEPHPRRLIWGTQCWEG